MSSAPRRPSTEPTAARAADGSATEVSASRRPWYDLGFTFTPRGALWLLVLLALGVGFSFGVDRLIERFVSLDERRIGEWINEFGALGPIVYIALLASAVIFTPLPSVPLNIAGGVAFGLLEGTLYTMIGGIIGATVNFHVARWLGRRFVERKLGAKAMAQIDALADRMGGKLIFFTRLIPLFNFDWVSYAAGLTQLTFKRYIIASIFGMLLPVIGIVYVGDVLLTHPGRSALVFGALVAWSATPPVVFLIWVGIGWLRRKTGRATRADAPARTTTGGGK